MLNRLPILIIGLIAGSLLSSCSKSAFYADSQRHLERECALLPPGQYDECMEDANKDFDEYEKERERYLDEVENQEKQEELLRKDKKQKNSKTLTLIQNNNQTLSKIRY